MPSLCWGGRISPPSPVWEMGEPPWLQAGLCRRAGEQPWARGAIRTGSAELVTDLFSKWDLSAASVAFLPGPRSHPVPRFPSLCRGERRIWECLQGLLPPSPSPRSVRLSVRLSVHTPIAPLLYAPSSWMPQERPGGNRGRDLSCRDEEWGKGPTPARTHKKPVGSLLSSVRGTSIRAG